MNTFSTATGQRHGPPPLKDWEAAIEVIQDRGCERRKGDKRLRLVLLWHRKQSDLLQKREIIANCPMFHHLAMSDAEDMNMLDGSKFACRSQTWKRTRT